MNKNVINQFEHDIQKIYKLGHITSIAYMQKRKGIELFLPGSISSQKAQEIATFIKNKYNFQAYFFVKKHNISVYYEN